MKRATATAPRLEPDADTAAGLIELLDDPVAFAHGVFTDRLWSRQEDMLRAIAKPKASVAVKGCHASAKTHAAARAALWFLSRYDDGIVVTTAPKQEQLELLLWKEIRAAIRQSRLAFPVDPLTTALKLSEDNYMVGFVAKDAERMQGFHAPHLLFIIEEAPGVAPYIYEAIEGARAGGDVRILALGNPTIASGPFYEAFTSPRWTKITISALDTPNLAGVTLDLIEQHDDLGHEFYAYEPTPYLATRRWVREKWEEWGRYDDPRWYGRVLGQFPPQSPDALVALTHMERAAAAEPLAVTEVVEAGVDVAGPGEDETSLTVRCGPNVLLERAWPIPDPRGELVGELKKFPGVRVKVDSAGIGYYLAKHLEDLGFDVEYVNVGEAASDPEQFKNLKAELYWGLRLRFQDGEIRGAIGELTVKQLGSIRWGQNPKGQVFIESKEDARKRGVPSPDRAESFMLAYARSRAPGMLDWLKEELAKRAQASAAAEAARGSA